MEREHVFWSGASGCAIGCLAVLVGFLGVFVIFVAGCPRLLGLVVIATVMAGILRVSMLVDAGRRKAGPRTDEQPRALSDGE